MSSSSDINLINLLNNVSNELNRYLGIAIFLFGIVGNALNILVLAQRTFHGNPCARLFLVSSVAFSIALVSGLSARILSTWAADLTNTNQLLCKIRIFIYFTSLTVACWLISLATVDRWLLSSKNVNLRQRSTLKNVHRSIAVVVISTAVIETQQLYCFEANLVNTPIQCYTKNVICGIISDLTLALVTILFSLVLMIVFGLMTVSNVRQSRSLLRPMNAAMSTHVGHDSVTVVMTQQNQRKKTDNQLLIMLLVQVLLIVFFTVPIALTKLYTTVTRNSPKSMLQKTVENFILTSSILLLNVAAGMPFYIYTLSGGSVFRKAVFDLVRILIQKLQY